MDRWTRGIVDETRAQWIWPTRIPLGEDLLDPWDVRAVVVRLQATARLSGRRPMEQAEPRRDALDIAGDTAEGLITPTMLSPRRGVQ